MVSKITYENVEDDCKIVYAENREEKGDSWKSMPIIQLENKFEEEFEEWKILRNFPRNPSQNEERYKELIDIILVAKMLCERHIKENQEVSSHSSHS